MHTVQQGSRVRAKKHISATNTAEREGQENKAGRGVNRETPNKFTPHPKQVAKIFWLEGEGQQETPATTFHASRAIACDAGRALQ